MDPKLRMKAARHFDGRQTRALSWLLRKMSRHAPGFHTLTEPTLNCETLVIKQEKKNKACCG